MKDVTNVIARNPTLWQLYADFIKLTEYFDNAEVGGVIVDECLNKDETNKRAIAKEIINLELKSVKSLMIIDW